MPKFSKTLLREQLDRMTTQKAGVRAHRHFTQQQRQQILLSHLHVCQIACWLERAQVFNLHLIRILKNYAANFCVSRASKKNKSSSSLTSIRPPLAAVIMMKKSQQTPKNVLNKRIIKQIIYVIIQKRDQSL